MPSVTMIAGPNGSGKSTLIQLLLEMKADLGRHFNADEIARSLGGGREANLRAQAIVRDGRAEALASGIDYSWETVMSHPSHIEHLGQARAAGYEVAVVYVCIDDPEVNVDRVAERVDAGDHNVSEADIRKRYTKSLANLPAAIIISHDARIYDNSLAYEPMRPVAQWDGSRLTLCMDPLPRWFAAVPPILAKADCEIVQHGGDG